MKTITHWIPAAICIFLLLLAFATYNGSDPHRLHPPSYVLLTICFTFVGAAISRMSGEIRELKAQIAALQGKQSA